MAQDFIWQDGERVMFIGDSTMEDPQGYTRLVPTMVTARYPERAITYIPRGVGGNRIGDLLERIDRDILNGSPLPTWIVIDIGINDVQDGANTGTPLGRFRELYSALLQRLKDTGANLMCLTTTVIGEELGNEMNRKLVGYNDAIREIAFQQGAQVVDVNTVFQDAIRRAQARNPNFRYTTDGRHLDAYGQYLVAEILLGALHFKLEQLAA
ncbi:MAG: SGNH/GDSL hydrolase family protein [Armatimonadota bacterium]